MNESFDFQSNENIIDIEYFGLLSRQKLVDFVHRFLSSHANGWMKLGVGGVVRKSVQSLIGKFKLHNSLPKMKRNETKRNEMKWREVKWIGLQNYSYNIFVYKSGEGKSRVGGLFDGGIVVLFSVDTVDLNVGLILIALPKLTHATQSYELAH